MIRKPVLFRSNQGVHTHTHHCRCEYAADYHTDSPHMLCFERLPDEAAQRAFTQAYVHKLVKLWRTHRVRSALVHWCMVWMRK